jgi:hypothetical protein
MKLASRSLAKNRRRKTVRPEVELLEGRNLLSGATLGPLVQVTPTDLLAGNTADNPASQPGVYYPSSEVEPYFVVNPANPTNMVGVWQQDRWSNGGSRGIGIAVSFDGGTSWKTGMMPGLTLTAGGSFQRAVDSWLSFAPNGDLYFSAIVLDLRPVTPAGVGEAPTAIVAEKSIDGGLDWSAPITLIQSDAPGVFNDKPSITADPTVPGSAYTVWWQIRSSSGPAMFSRTTDGGQSWSAPSPIFSPTGTQGATWNQLIVRPNGSLADFMFVEPTGPSAGPHLLNGSLVLSQSTDKGQTWSSTPTQVASIQSIGDPTDPNTGQGISGGVFNVAEDPNNGNLYVAWIDARFSNFQHDSIAFSMSTDGGATWSAPIRINQTPTNIPNGNQQAFLPSIAVAANGAVAVTYDDFRFNGTGPGTPTDCWLVQGRAGTDLTNPANWGNEVRLTNTSFDVQAAPQNGEFLGDYQGFAAAGNDFDAFFAATNGTDPGDIYFRDPPALENAPASVPTNGSPLQAVADIGARDAFFALVNAFGSTWAAAPVTSGQPTLAIQSGVITASVPQSVAPIDQSGGQGSGSAIKHMTPAVTMEAVDTVFAEAADTNDSVFVPFAG